MNTVYFMKEYSIAAGKFKCPFTNQVGFSLTESEMNKSSGTLI